MSKEILNLKLLRSLKDFIFYSLKLKAIEIIQQIKKR